MTAATAVHRELETTPADAAEPVAAHPSDLLGVLPDLFAPTSPAETLKTVVSTARRTFGC